MSRETRTGRLTHPASARPTTLSGDAVAVAPSLLSLLAAGSGLVELLPQLHQHAIDVTGGTCTLLFEHNPRNGSLQATSGYGLDELRTDPWIPGPEETAAGRRGVLAPARLCSSPTSAARCRSSRSGSARRRRGCCRWRAATSASACSSSASASAPDGRTVSADASTASDAFLAALELFRLRRRDELQRDLRALIDEFSAGISATLNLAAGLEIFCLGAKRLFGADRTSVWIHDRRARHLVLQASSDPGHVARGVTRQRARTRSRRPPPPCGARARRVTSPGATRRRRR